MEIALSLVQFSFFGEIEKKFITPYNKIRYVDEYEKW